MCDPARESLLSAQSWLDQLRVDIASALVKDVRPFVPDWDPADMHEDFREAMIPFFDKLASAWEALEAQRDEARSVNGWLGHENMKRERDEARAALVAFTESKTVCSVAPSLVRAARAALGEPAE